MNKWVSLLVSMSLLLSSLVAQSIVGYPKPIEGQKIEMNNPQSVQKLIKILEAYPKTLKMIELQQSILDHQSRKIALYKEIERKLSLKANNQKLMAIGLGIGIPIAVGLSIWAGIEIGKIFR